MNSSHAYRLYTFIADQYLSPRQEGLQVANLIRGLSQGSFTEGKYSNNVYREWADLDAPITICGAVDHQGVLGCWAELERLAPSLALPHALVRESTESMNRMATACGVIVPKKYWDVKLFKALVPGTPSAVREHYWMYGTDSHPLATEDYWEFSYEKNGQSHRDRYLLTQIEDRKSVV